MVRLCIMRCFHPDKLMQEIKSFISYFLGSYFVEIPRFNFAHFLIQTSEYRPVLFLVGPNVNALTELVTFKENLDNGPKNTLDYQPLGSISTQKVAK